MFVRPPIPASAQENERRRQISADQEGVEQQSGPHGKAELIQPADWLRHQHREGPRENQPRRTDDSATADQRRMNSSLQAMATDLLTDSGHEEDVVIDSERNQEDEDVECVAITEALVTAEIKQDENTEAKRREQRYADREEQVRGRHH